MKYKKQLANIEDSVITKQIKNISMYKNEKDIKGTKYL